MELAEIIGSDDQLRLETFLSELPDVGEFSKVECDGYLPIHLVSLLGKAEMVKTMANKGVDVNEASSRGYTALHFAGAWGHLETLRALIASGADPSLVNVRSETATIVAERYCNQDCVDYLRAAEAAGLFKSAIASAREILGDTDRISGKWNKDDKNKVTSLCKEKWDWLTLHQGASVQDIGTQREDFDARFATYMNKLQPPSQ